MTDPTSGRSRGVSEVLGFVFVFAMVLSAIVVLTGTGYAGLRDVRDDQRLDNAEYSFEVLADNVDESLWYGAPSRSTEIKLAGAQVTMADPVTVNVTAHPVGDPSATTAYEYDVAPVVYDAGTGATLAYSNGAVLRQHRSGTVLVREPRLLFASDRTTLPVIQTRTAAGGGVGGSTNAQIRTRRTETEVVVARSDPTVVEYTITSPRAAAWYRHLAEAYPDATCGYDDESVTCSVTTDRVYVTVARVDVSIA